MAFATVEQLAAAMRMTVTDKNRDALQSCVDAAAQEIVHYCDRFDGDPLPTTPPEPLTVQVNIVRGVEWWKANDAIWGGVGFADTGILTVPRDSFARYATALIPLVQQFGIA